MTPPDPTRPTQTRFDTGLDTGEEATRIRAVFFDLDGTLADTAPDLAHALNTVREEEGLPALAFEHIRPEVSHGARALINLGFSHAPDTPEFERLRQRLLAVYRDNLALHTRLFPGMAEVLDTLERMGLRWGVVTNKPGWLTEPLLDALGLMQRAACVVSGDTLAERKPHPAPMLHACRQLGCEPVQCVYLGDAERDIQAGRAAGMPSLVACFGYIGAQDRPEHWGADALLDSPGALLDWLADRH